MITREQPVIQNQESINAALDAALRRAEAQDAGSPLSVEIDRARLIFFSDHHKGSRNGADDFQPCERAYNAALAYYYRQGHTLVIVGDAEELWEERPQAVVRAYEHTLKLEGRFLQDERYLRIWGNHDDDWQHPDLVAKLLSPALGSQTLQVREQLLIHIRKDDTELGRLLVLHGHQGTLESDLIAPFSKFFVRYFWRPFQRLFKISLNTPANDFRLRYAHDNALYRWSEAQSKTVLIAGHTHHPVFKSESHAAQIRKALAKVERALKADPDNRKLRTKAAELSASLEWVLAQNRQNDNQPPPVALKKPSYFNTGCCAYADGDITGLEICDGEIRLVHWPNAENLPRPKTLVAADLQDVLAAC